MLSRRIWPSSELALRRMNPTPPKRPTTRPFVTTEIQQLRKFREELITQKSALLKENTELKGQATAGDNDLKLTQARNEDVVNQVSELER